MITLMLSAAFAAPAGWKVTDAGADSGACELSLGPAEADGVVPMRAECYWKDVSLDKFKAGMADWNKHDEAFTAVAATVSCTSCTTCTLRTASASKPLTIVAVVSNGATAGTTGPASPTASASASACNYDSVPQTVWCNSDIRSTASASFIAICRSRVAAAVVSTWSA